MSVEYSEITQRLQRVLGKIEEVREAIGIDAARRRVAELEERMSGEGFWSQPDRAQEVIGELKRLRSEIEPLDDAWRRASDDLELAELAHTERDSASLDEIAEDVSRLDDVVEELELLTMLSGKYDANNAYLTVHAGAGGTESCDWAAMLVRMFRRFADRQGYQTSIIDVLEGEEAGIKSCTIHVKGRYAYGYLRAEVGVHRLVRKSPFDAKNKRHTSFAAVELAPEVAESDDEVDVNEADLRIDTYRAGGAGGQHVNTTDSAVRITHLPSGIVVQCQNERSQHSNRATAMKMLRAKLAIEREREREAELEKLHGEKGEIAWGNQIRSYVLDPYTLVKDRRTGHETGNVDAVLDGDIFRFIKAFLRHKRSQAGSKPPSDD
jgi:peptide chain release factor 2